jgi:hypothetical protein
MKHKRLLQQALWVALTVFIGHPAFSKGSKDFHLIVHLNSIPLRIHVNESTGDLNAYRVLSSAHTGLVTIDSTGQVYPSAAKSWKIENDGKRYRFQLQSRLFFQKRGDFSCEDVRESLLAARNKSASLLGIGSILKEVACVSEKGNESLVLDLSRSSGSILFWLGTVEALIIPKGTQRSDTNTLVGLGPYTVTLMNSERVILAAKTGHPFISLESPQTIELLASKGSAKSLADVQAGKAHVFPLDGSVFAATGTYLPAKVVTSSGYDRIWTFLAGKDLTPAADDAIELMRCFSHRLSRESFITSLTSEDGTSSLKPAYGVAAPSMGGFAYNPLAKAQAPSCQLKIPRSKLKIMHIKEDRTPDVLKKWVATELQKHNFESEFNPLTKAETLKAFMTGQFELALMSFSMDSTPEANYNFMFSPRGPAAFQWLTKPHLKSGILDLVASTSEAQRLSLITKLETAFLESPVLVPLVFERQSYLFSKCISAGHKSWSAGNERFESYRRKPNCVDTWITR